MCRARAPRRTACPSLVSRVVQQHQVHRLSLARLRDMDQVQRLSTAPGRPRGRTNAGTDCAIRKPHDPIISRRWILYWSLLRGGHTAVRNSAFTEVRRAGLVRRAARPVCSSPPQDPWSDPASRRFRSQGGIPVAPKGLAARPLPDKPVVFDTAEGQNIRVVVVTKALEYPWSLAFLPDGSMLVTERAGRLRIIRNGVLDPQAGRRRAGVVLGRRIRSARRGSRLHGHRAPSAVRREPVRLSHLHEAARREAPDRRDRARTLGRQRAHRRARHLRRRTTPARRASRSAATARSS